VRQRPRQGEQHRAPSQVDLNASATDPITARVHHQRHPGQQGLHLFQHEQALFAPGNQARGGRAQQLPGAFDFGAQRTDSRLLSGVPGSFEGGAGGLRLQAPHGDPRGH
jgi:hypothetical protein